MKLNNMFNSGACGIEQALYLGSVSFDTDNISTGAPLENALPAGFVATRFVCNVKTAFNAATTNVLTLGTVSDDDAFMGASDINEAAGASIKHAWQETGGTDVPIRAKYTQTGTAATAGEAEFYAFLMRLPE